MGKVARKKIRFKKSVKVYFIIILLLIVNITITVFNKDYKKDVKKIKDESSIKIKKNKEENQPETVLSRMKKLSYYKKEYDARYQNYYDEYPNLNEEDIVTRVNLFLDCPNYENTYKSPYLNNDYILVNKHIYMGEGYVPDNLEELDTSYSRSGMKLVSTAKSALEKMVKNASEDGYTIRVMSSYRSYEYQVNLYNRYKEQDGVEAADTYSARPGYSEHQTGLCMDIDDGKIDYTNFEASPSFKWMQDNAYKYGFILRYPDGKTDITGYTYESWHYRYVGEEIAKYIKENDTTFDEYYAQFIDNKK